MEASTSQLQATSSPDTTARMAIRQRPQIHVAPHGPPSQPTWVQFWHPANNLAFLRLPVFDCCPPTFGVHYGTAITACQILACNEKGYLSTSRDGHAHGRINADLDSIISPGKYYYHLSSPKSEALYPICCDFSCWKFPHEKLPSAWKQELPDGTTVDWPTNWTAINERIKSRDIHCLVSEWMDCLTTFHVVAKVNEKWVHKMLVFDVGLLPICHLNQLVQNNMDVYFDSQHFLSDSPRNLFALRYDLHLDQFDRAGFVIVPKLGQLVVHFLRPAQQSAQQYHNVQFDHKKTLSHEALYARFAWALMKIVKSTLADPKEFRILTASDIDGGISGDGGDEGGGGRNKGSGVKRKRNDENQDDESHCGTGATFGPGSDWRSSNHVTSDACPRESRT